MRNNLSGTYNPDVQIETLKIFCDLVETQSFSLAAERNFVTQSAVSQQVRGLEEKSGGSFGARARAARDSLTEAGRVHVRAERVRA